MMKAWRPFNVRDMPDKLTCPTLFMMGEAELAEQKIGPFIYSEAEFLQKVRATAWVHEFGFDEGYAASHCQIGAQSALNETVFDWLDFALVHPERQKSEPSRPYNLALLMKYFGKDTGIREVAKRIHLLEF